MKVAHRNKAIDTEVEHKAEEQILNAAAFEREGNVEAAIKAYEATVRSDELNMKAYDRLMILYRKQKEYTKEVKLITAAIKAYQDMYDKGTVKRSTKVRSISEQLNKAMGLIDKKGKATYEPEPIARWRKRLTTVEKRLNK